MVNLIPPHRVLVALILAGVVPAAWSAELSSMPPPPPPHLSAKDGLFPLVPAPQAPSTIDLDATYIERLPRYNYDATKNNPAVGDTVTFRGHIRCLGTGSLASAGYRWQLDGATIASGTLTALNAGEERIVTCTWTWQSGNHTIQLAADPDNLIAETIEANNIITDRTNGIIVGFWVEQSLYNNFAQYQNMLTGAGSNSWEDWAQRQMRYWNQFSAQAIYTTTPTGVLDRVRIDKIVVVADGALPLHGGLATNNPDLNDRTVDMMWGFQASSLSGTFYSDHTSVSMGNPFYYEGSLLHELGHARYLVDSYGFDVHNTSAWQSVQIYENGSPVAGSTYMPFIAFGEVLYYNKWGKMMSGGYDQGWSEFDAGALNRIAGQRALCGNYNAPCNIGVYLNNLPLRNHVKLTDGNGAVRAGADVKVYRAVSGSGWYGKTIDNTPDLSFTTDGFGYANMPQNPFSSGSIQHTYGISNGVMVIRVQQYGQVWYRFVEVGDFNIQYWRGNTQDAYYTISLPGTNFARMDYNFDNHVDEVDFAHFLPCLQGADIPPASGCADADLDSDNDVDQGDFGIFQRCISGMALVNLLCG